MSRTAEEWGRIAVSLPGWRWMTGMQTLPLPHPDLPDCDDAATEGCLIRLLGSARLARQALTAAGHYNEAHRLHIAFMLGKGIGPACIGAAEALGQWSGGGHASNV